MDETIDWDGTAAIERNRQGLLRVLAGLMVMARLAPRSLAGGGENLDPPAGALPRYLYLAVLRLLRPAESAMRRLIIAAARPLVVTVLPPRPREASKRRSAFLRKPGGTGILLPRGVPIPGAPPRAAARSHGFPLFDPLRNPMRRHAPRRAQSVPRISVPGFTTPFPIPPARRPDDPIDVTRLARRLTALAAALGDLPAQARRFARWRAIRKAARAQATGAPGPRPARRLWPLRQGRPPGSRSAKHRRDGSEVDGILAHSHSLAVFALDQPDTS